MILNLFSNQIWKVNLNIEKEFGDNLLNQINLDYKKNQKIKKPDWNCNVYTTIDSNNNIDYSGLLYQFKNEYIKFSEKNNLNAHNFCIKNIWYNYYLKNSNQEIHDHIDNNCFYSGVFFLKINDKHPPITFYNYTNAHLFYSSNTLLRQAYKKESIDHSVVYPYFTLDIKENDFIIFPSYLPHGVFVQRTDEPRITISMNFTLENTND
jgi:uncharacterized protein (TIGR02466 family)